MMQKNRENKPTELLESQKPDTPFGCKKTRHIALTYHKLPMELDMFVYSREIINNVNDKIKSDFKFQTVVKLVEMFLQKEEYDLSKNPDNKGLVHIHALFSFNKPIDLRYNVSSYAQLFTLSLGDKDYYPHVAPVARKDEYEEYITKMHKVDPKYRGGDFFLYWEDAAEDEIDAKIELAFHNSTVLSPEDVNVLISSVPQYLRDKKWKTLMQLNVIARNNLNNKVSLAHLAIDFARLEYKAQDFGNNENYVKIKQVIEQAIDSPSKQSPVFVAVGNLGKTSMVLAALEQIANGIDELTITFTISTYKDFRDLNARDLARYRYVFYVLDDFEWEEFQDRPNALKQLFLGPAQTSSIATMYGSIQFRAGHSIKIFCMNHDSLNSLKKVATPEVMMRLKIIHLNERIRYSQ